MSYLQIVRFFREHDYGVCVQRLSVLGLLSCALSGCGGGDSTTTSATAGTTTTTTTMGINAPVFLTTPPVIVQINEVLALDAADYFTGAVSYAVGYAAHGIALDGVTLAAGVCSGTPLESGVFELLYTATSAEGGQTTASVICVVEAAVADLPLPSLPATVDDFELLVDGLPLHFLNDVTGFDNVSDTDNTPADNVITNATATLGRVLYYDKRVSANNTISCATCHQQEHGFSDPRALSLGFKGAQTDRHAQGLTNGAFYERGHFFWDERADTLEDQVLLPIQSAVEMGMTLPDLITKLEATAYYGDLFARAYGDAAITETRIAKALAQFVRSMLSYDSGFDRVFDNAGTPNYALLSAAEQRGLQLFSGKAGIAGRNLRCDACHTTVSQGLDRPRNIGLDVVDSDDGAGNGAMKVPSLRNVGLRKFFMHDGRFTSLREVVMHYSTGVQDNPNLDDRLRARNGTPLRPNLSATEVNDLIAFLESLTEAATQTNVLHEDPFGALRATIMNGG